MVISDSRFEPDGGHIDLKYAVQQHRPVNSENVKASENTHEK